MNPKADILESQFKFENRNEIDSQQNRFAIKSIHNQIDSQ